MTAPTNPAPAPAPDLLDAAKLGASGLRTMLAQVPRGYFPALRREFELHLVVIDAAVAKAELR